MRFEPDSAIYRFRHALVQEAAYDSLLRAERAGLHRAVGEALARSDPARLDELAPRISEHFEAAGDAPRALQFARRAADAAFRRYALPEAIAQFMRSIHLAVEVGLPSAELTDLYLRAGRAIELTDRYRDAVVHYQAMVAAARGLGDRRMELAGLAAQVTSEAYGISDQDPELDVQVRARQALELARELGDRTLEAKLLWTLMLLNRFGIGDMQAGLDYGMQSLAISREIGLEQQAALAGQDLARALLHHRPARGGVRPHRAADCLLRRSGDLPLLAEGLRIRSTIDWIAGRFTDSLRGAQEASAIDETTSNVWGRAFSRVQLGAVHLELGEIESARRPSRKRSRSRTPAESLCCRSRPGWRWRRSSS